MKDFYKEGKLFEKTEIWAEGLDKWYHLSAVAQFRWTVCLERPSASAASPNVNMSVGPLYNFTDICTTVLDTLIQMCSFFPSRYGHCLLQSKWPTRDTE